MAKKNLPQPEQQSHEHHRRVLESMGSQVPHVQNTAPSLAPREIPLHNPPPGIDHERIIDLRQYYGISFIFTLQKSLWVFVLVFFAWALYLSIVGFQDVKIPLPTGSSFSLLFMLRVVTLLPLLVVGYWELYRGTIELRIEGFRLILITGVFLKFYDSRAICSVSSFAIFQSNWDKFFNVFYVEFLSGPTPPEVGPLTVHGFTEEDALRLDQYLSTQISRLCAPSSDAIADDERTMSKPED